MKTLLMSLAALVQFYGIFYILDWVIQNDSIGWYIFPSLILLIVSTVYTAWCALDEVS